MDFKIQSPTRIDLAGGTLDFWPIYLMVPGAMTINCSIDIYTSVEFSSKADSSIDVFVENLDFKKTYKDHNEFASNTDDETSLIRVVAEYFGDVGGYSIVTRSQSPVGGGLGGSSSLCISLIDCYLKVLGQQMGVVDKVRLAANLEAVILKTPTGCQDHFPAANQGLNVIRFEPLNPILESIDFDEDYFNERCFLVDTGKAHHSGINNWQVYKAAIEGDQKVLDALREISSITNELQDVLKSKDYGKVPDIFNREFESRVQLAQCFSSPEIEQLKEISLGAGASAVKICGAGGGGCVLVMAPPEKRESVIQACSDKGFRPLKINLLPAK